MPGAYLLQVEYRGRRYKTATQEFSETPVRSNSVSFTITPASEAEEKEAELYLQTVRASGEEGKRVCAKFLESYPASRFAGRVRYQLFDNLRRLGDLDSARELYSKLLVATDLSRHSLLQVQLCMAYALEKKGLYQEAIAILEKWPREQDNVKEKIAELKKKAKEAAATPTKEVQPFPSP
jgi:tetratricopeptide (TPR) repeat protein